MVDPELRVTVDLLADLTDASLVMKVCGEIDIQSAAILAEHLESALDQGHATIDVDFSEVTFLDSTGLSVLIGALARCQAAGGELRVLSPRPNVRRVLEITGLIEAFHLGGGGAAPGPE